MLRHFLIAALRNMAANWLLSAIIIFGLAMGLTAAILAAVIIANQATFDHFIPSHNRLFMATVDATLGGKPTDHFPFTPHDLAAHIKQDFPEIASVARIKKAVHGLRHGSIEAQETMYSADPNIFELIQLPVLYGDLNTALSRPDTIVIPQQIARKYFGRDNVVGQTLELNRQHLQTITAVIADLPANASNLQTGIFLSGRSNYSDLSIADRKLANARDGNFALDVQTLIDLAPGASIESLRNRMLTMTDTLLPRPSVVSANLRLVRLDALHLSPELSPGVRDNLEAFGVIAILILVLSSINFINLSTARAGHRAVEVGLRKALGAARQALIVQFLGELILQVMLALLLAVALAEWSLPAVNTFLQAGAAFDYWRNPGLILLLLLSASAIGILAGAYPAFVLSGFRPAAVLKGRVIGAAASARQLLVTLQFSALVVLAIAAGVVFQQHSFALRESLRPDTDQMLFVQVSQCQGSFANEVAALPDVRGVACSDTGFVQEINSWLVRRSDGTTTALNMVGTGPGLLELYGQKPVAGRTLRQSDIIGDDPGRLTVRDAPVNFVINESAVRKLGFASPQDAIGRVLHLENLTFTAVIVGVVKDTSISTLEKKIDATAYDYFMQDHLLHIKLVSQNIPGTLAAIDTAWNRSGATGPIRRTFVDSYIENLHLSLLREGQAFTVFAGVAMLLACLGLFGLSIFTAERRTKEIGVRKAMGATTEDIVLLLLWQFGKPVLLANFIAWPIAWWLMNRWLDGFAYHVPLHAWIFFAGSAAALAIALATVAGQAISVARRKPLMALRYE